MLALNADPIVIVTESTVASDAVGWMVSEGEELNVMVLFSLA